MYQSFLEKNIKLLILMILLLPMVKILFPIMLPFLLGGIIALVAEPAVSWLHRKLHFRRGYAVAMGVTGVFLLSTSILTILLSLFLRQLAHLTDFLPAASVAIQQGASLLKNKLIAILERCPAPIRSTLSEIIHAIFSSDNDILQQTAKRLPQMAGNIISRLSSGFIGVFTSLLSAFMISSRLPQLRQKAMRAIPTGFTSALKELRHTLFRWICAQGKLATVALGVLLVGFMLLKIENPLLWAILITTVDILPILGVGTILLPWSIVSYLQHNISRSLGLLGIFVVIWLLRSVLEPKLVGKELGLDPLATLLCIYAGFRIWGIAGILIAPMVAVCIVQLKCKTGLNKDSDTA